MLLLGIDIGGTSIKSDIYDEKGCSQKYFQERETPVDLEKGTNQIADCILNIITDYLDRGIALAGVGISSAGVIDATLGEVVYAGPTIPDYKGTALKQLVEETFNLPCAVENDVNCAALGESWLGAGKGASSLVCLTVGTGIGGAIVLNGKVWRGFSHSAGEVGYLPVQNDAWQNKASTTAMIKDYCQQKDLPTATGKAVFDAYDGGDDIASAVIDQFVNHFVEGLLPILYLINPEKLLIGGGILARSEILLPRISQRLESALQATQFLPKELESTKLGNEAGRIGAIYWLLQQKELLG
ncbi:ROK family protein [Streptococcus thoraltensis]|uniref:ROK family protein n=1 Tax=Streptococcus thoraltensis TaxID=55085 RepID=UPI00036D1CE6|nr:ROK family protein [Streptococcus thoraltensis]MDY4760448.1 ROK family protein [Streptococcus thoraltensis]